MARLLTQTLTSRTLVVSDQRGKITIKTNDNLVGRDEGGPKHKTNALQFHHVKNAQTRETTGLTQTRKRYIRSEHKGRRRRRRCCGQYLSGVVEDAARGRGHDVVEALALQLRVAGDSGVELRYVWFKDQQTGQARGTGRPKM